jgi:hypothetical protein
MKTSLRERMKLGKDIIDVWQHEDEQGFVRISDGEKHEGGRVT